MTVEELKMHLVQLAVPEHMYSILKGGFPNEALCLVREANSWEVYYSERGQKSGTKRFAEETAACEYMLGKLLKYGQIVR